MVKETLQINADTYKFQLAESISNTEKSYKEANQATLSPIARKLFGFPWTQNVKIGTNYVELTKQDWVDWETLLEPLIGLINEHFEMTEKPYEENPTPPASEDKGLSSPEAQQIQHFIKEQVNPSLAMHGGWAELKGFENGRAFLLLGGGCQGCGMSYTTLKEGIETALKESFPFVTDVADVTDHASGENPYY